MKAVCVTFIAAIAVVEAIERLFGLRAQDGDCAHGRRSRGEGSHGLELQGLTSDYADYAQ